MKEEKHFKNSAYIFEHNDYEELLNMEQLIVIVFFKGCYEYSKKNQINANTKLEFLFSFSYFFNSLKF
jgi:hypothetical protein